MSQPVIRMEDVTAGYSREHPAIRDINITVEQNDFLAVLGPNGGGKTTLLKVILGLLKPFSGVVSVLGAQPDSIAAQHRIGYVPQVVPTRTFPATVLDVTLLGRLGRKGLFRRFSQKDRDAAMANLERLGVENLRYERIDQLSGGQKQRVLIARALAGDPEMLLLDEPVASVDQETQNSFYNLLAELNQHMTIVLVTHDVGAVSTHVKTIACINTRLFSHGSSIEEKDVSTAYGCPFELISHGVPHRVLGRRSDQDAE